MPKKLRKVRSFYPFLLLLALFASAIARGQTAGEQDVIGLLRQLEARHQVAFSYVDEDLGNLRVGLPADLLASLPLEPVLEELRQQIQLRIEKLNERYYTVAKSNLVTICGQVYDNFEDNTISGASVEVLGSSIATVTGPDGAFRLQEIPRGATLRIRHLGFRTRYMRAEELVRRDRCTPLLLPVRYQELQEVVVYKFLTSGLRRGDNGSILMMPSEFGVLPGLTEPDVLQTIQALPGIKSVDETVSNINIRGGTNDQNLLLWDGIKMYQSGHFFGLISAFNPYLTREVEIIKNGSSARYGDGLSGIISMHTHDEVERTYFGGAGLNLLSGDAYGHIPISDRLAIQVSGRRSVTDFLNTPTYSNFSDRAFQDTQVSGPGGQNTERFQSRDEDFYFYDISAKLLYDLNAYHKLRVSALNIENQLSYREVLAADSTENRSRLDQSNLAVGGRLTSEWSDRFSTAVSGYFTRYLLDSYYATEASQQQLFQANEVEETALKTEMDYALNPYVNWQAGYQFLVTGITNNSEVNQPPFLSRIKDVLYTHALFSEWRYTGPGKRLDARAGLRLNYLSNPDDFDRFRLEPRLNLQYKLRPHLVLGVLGEMKNQTSLQKIDLEQNFLGIEKRRWILADDQNLPLVTSRQISLGLHHDRGHWIAGIEGFYKEVDGITTDTQGFQNEYQFNGELGRYRVHGVEALLNFKSAEWSSWVSYAWNRNDYRFEDLDPAEFPNNLDIRHTISFGTNYTSGNLKLGIGVNYRTGRPYTEPEPEPNSVDTSVFPNRVNFSEPNSSRLPEYFRADASAIYGFELSETVRASVGASVLNLTGRRNILNTYYRLNDQNEVEQVENVSLGLTPNLSLRVRF
ncbi:TonB-dependent receptor [Robiginitalea biformata]|uniref:Putative outer membrane protein probably involved in nutrient binding n=1 Tax=Robiginitalea biformata (strain ATCC BAA-864 / DSM 15991 / KCTC 12146 / HTCC2501) TaxID=313596 RepID=A4CJY0_ROBBH|nr:TonB-dependent receptor plug domain-containing protein [Robiginitalea biformata]EAR17238.1 putative outer membrane protein probably involved in nutrient binding [Robiginitalea biformata HTCC2501]